jgi:hypothetical protein
MCVGIIKNELMVRLDPEDYADTLKLPGAREMDFTGRPMKGYLIVGDEGIDSDAGLESWIDRAITFNPKAKSSKKKK